MFTTKSFVERKRQSTSTKVSSSRAKRGIPICNPRKNVRELPRTAEQPRVCNENGASVLLLRIDEECACLCVFTAWEKVISERLDAVDEAKKEGERYYTQYIYAFFPLSQPLSRDKAHYKLGRTVGERK